MPLSAADDMTADPHNASPSSVPQPTTASLPAAMNSSNPSSDMEKLASLTKLSDSLAHSVKCPVCLDYMEDARQLQCGHLFCAECVVRILGMRKVRCAICKDKTSKRMVRAAPFPYGPIVQGLRALEDIIQKCNARPNNKAKLHDGFFALNAALTQMRNAQQQRVSVPKTPAKKSSTPAKKISTPKLAAPKKTQPETETEDKACVFCPKSIDSIHGGSPLDLGKLEAVRFGNTPVIQYVHERCAFFSEEVYAVDGRILNLDRITRRTENKRCYRRACEQSHPTVTCAVKDCNVWMHCVCALVDGCELVDDGYKMFCPAHKNNAPKIDEDFVLNLTDPSDASNVNHEDACYLCKTGGRLLMCDTCERVTHPACSGLQGIPLGDWSCGVCSGIHKAPPKTTPSGEGASAPSTLPLKRPRSDSPGDIAGDRIAVDPQSRPSSQKRARRASDGLKRTFVAHTGLKDDQKEVLQGLLKSRRTTVKEDIEDRVSYVIVGVVQADEAPTRTMKLCRAVARKVPILCWSWVEESRQCADTWAPIESHVHSLTLRSEEAAIFEGRRFCFACYSGSKSKREEFMDLVRMAGGTVVQREDRSKGVESETLYVREEETSKKRSRGAKSRFEPPSGATVVSCSWILDQLTKERMG